MFLLLFPMLLFGCHAEPVEVNAWDSPVGNDWEQVVAGWHNATCGRKQDGTVNCWGSDVAERWIGNPIGHFKDIDIGDHFCGITSDESVECDSMAAYGDLSALNEGDVYQDISQGPFLCVLTTEGALRCLNGYPQDEDTFAQLSGAASVICALRDNGVVTCWDREGNALNYAGPYVQVDVGEFYTCAITVDGALDCWGQYDGPGDGSTGPFTAVSVGSGVTCAIELSQEIYCWWDSSLIESVHPPVGNDYVAVSAGTNQACGLHEDGSIACAEVE
jgi:hypothetical protein